MPNIEERVRDIIRDHLGLDAKPETGATLRDDCGADSLDAIELVLEMEDAFGIEINDDEIESLKIVADWIEIVERQVKEAA